MPGNTAALTAHHTPASTSNKATLSLGNVSPRDHVPAEFKPRLNVKQNECGVSERLPTTHIINAIIQAQSAR